MKDSYKSLKGQAGIYKISIGPHIYVGQSINLHSRLKTHKSQLKSGNHPNYRVQESYNHYGKSALVIEVLLIINNNDTTTQDINNKLNLMESNYIKELHADLNIQQVNPKRSTRFYRPQKVDTRNIITSTVLPTKLLKSFKSNWLYINPTERIVKTIGQDLFKLLQEAVPNVLANPKFRNLFLAILTKASTDGYVVTSEEWIAYYVDEWPAYITNNHKRFTAIKFLEALKKALPEDWNFEWTSPDYTENKARTTKITIPMYIAEAMYIDARDRPTPRYYLYKWNTKSTSRNASKASNLIYQMQQDYVNEAKHPYQTDILNYLSGRDIREFKPMDINRAHQVINTYPIGKKECYMQSLSSVVDYPKPMYYPVEGCYRIYAPGLQFLKSDIRKALYPKWIELDLKSCHTSILTTILNLPRTKEVLLDKQDFWVYLMFSMDCLMTAFIYPSVKKAIKKTLYALCFGAGVSSLKSIFIEEMEINTELKPNHIRKSWKSFKEIDVIQELSFQTKQWRAQLKQDGEYTDILGNHYIIKTDLDIRKACFNICSAYELALIYPIYQEAIEEAKKDRPQFKVLLHSHDGVSIHIPQEHMKTSVLNRLSNAVQKGADALRVPTYLESKTVNSNTQLVEDIGTLQKALVKQ